MSGRDDSSKLKKHAGFGLSTFSNFVDEHLQLVQRSVYGLGILTLIGIARHFKLWTRFNSRSQIPAGFFIKNVKLRGKVIDIRADTCTLLVDHRPALTALSWLSPSNSHKDRSYLSVNMAGINVTSAGNTWLYSNLLNNTIWFRLLESPDETIIPAIVSYRAKYSVRRNINLYLVYNGMAKVRQTSESDPTSQLYNRLIEQLVKAEVRAERKGVGDWEKVSWTRWLKDKFHSFFNRKK